ncbi:MAG TPA: hypothetical protein EYQ24_15360 [Bacteroidetes bacterium]|nr:hypothetical protein [Bacteroidota bacterium]
MPVTRLALAALAVLLAGAAPRAQPVFERLTRADGLPSDYVLAVYPDRWGFVWFGTDAGATRWDGARAVTFGVDDGLPHPYVTGFAETADGTLWAATNGGLARRTETGWEPVASPGGSQPIAKILADGEGRLVVAQSDRIARLEGVRWRVLARPGGFGHQRGLLHDIGEGRLLVSGLRQPAALVLTPEGESFRVDRVPIEGLDGRGGALVTVHPTTRGLFATLEIVGSLRPIRLAPLRIEGDRVLAGPAVNVRGGLAELVAHGGDLYATGSGGLRRIDPATGESGTLLLSFPVQTTALDREGGLWLGTFGQGAARLASTHLTALSDVPARRVALAGDEAWAFGNEGATHVRLTGGAADATSFRRSGTVRSGVATPDGRFRASGQAWLFAPTTSEDLRRFIPRRNGFPLAVEDGNWVSGSAETADSLWLGSYGSGLRRFRQSGGGLVEIDTVSVADGLPTEAVEDVIRTSAGTWALTRRGLALVVGGRARAMGAPEGLPSSAVFALYEARDGTHWVGTDRGIARLDLAQWTAERAGETGGRPTVAFFERRGALYAVTTRALWRVGEDGATLAEGVALTQDRAQTVEHAVYHAPSDRLLLATNTGPVLADLGALSAAQHLPPPPVALVSAAVDDEAVRLLGTPREASLPDLAPGRHRVTLQAAALRFAGPARVEWRLPGEAWHEAEDGRIVLSDVGAGTHRIGVRAVGPEGGDAGETARLTFRVAPQWWERRAVQGLLALAALAVLVGGVRYASQRRLRAQVRALELERRLQAERERISRDLHDHVGAEVAAILTEAEVARLEADAAGREAGAFREVEHRARRTMGSLREAIWALGHGALTPADLATRLGAFAEAQARHAEWAVTARATGDAHRALAPAQALALYRIGQEAVRNAVCHSGGSRLAITVEASRQRVAVVVRDDGTFRGPSGDGGGFGLGNMRARAEALGGSFAVTNGEGTAVRAEIPLEAA